MIFSFFYVSRRVIAATRSDHEIDDILSVARDRNLSLGVTGALLATPAYFAQVLEGSEANVEIIMDYIRRDARHRDIRIVDTEPLTERRFGNWNMAHVPPTTEVSAALTLLIGEAEAPQVAASFIELLRQSAGARLPV
ncbi:MAG: BLUF domain-containing protein [Pseudomonadota bacterium]|nr:BLUF domain-containing protein [Pseudomonadota bacterium]